VYALILSPAQIGSDTHHQTFMPPSITMSTPSRGTLVGSEKQRDVRHPRPAEASQQRLADM
jgi:hypothetical protein